MTKVKKKTPNVGAPFKSLTMVFSINCLNNSSNNNCNSVYESTKTRQTICSLENLDLGGISCVCPSEMGEGRDGPSHCPLFKVLVRSEEESLKSYAKPKLKSPQKRPMPQNLQSDYSQTLDTLADYRVDSSLEEELAD